MLRAYKLILRSLEIRTSMPMQVHDGPPNGPHSPSIILSADPCRSSGRDLHFAGVVAIARYALGCCLSMIFSENRCALFRIML
jgi:hypothetical protein